MKFKLHTPLYIHEIGNRPNQEDALYPINADSNNRVFILCDGMGGHQNGEVASQTVSQELGEWLANNTKSDEPFTDEQLSKALEYAYSKLDEHLVEGEKQMGTTLTLLYLHRHGVTAAHIGDSRIYHIRPQENPQKGILYQSRDHSLVFDLLLAEEITYEEMATYPRKNVITRAMIPGQDNRMRPDIFHITDIEPDDWFYMCSDGMMEQMTSEELAAILSSDMTDEAKREQLIKATANNQDNHTAWLIHIEEVVKEKGDGLLENDESNVKCKCNVRNIIPTIVPQTEEITDDEDDVVLISVPSDYAIQPKQEYVKSHSTLRKRFPVVSKILISIVLILLCLCLLVAAKTLFSLFWEKQEPQHIEKVKEAAPDVEVETPVEENEKEDTISDFKSDVQSSQEEQSNESTSNIMDIFNKLKTDK